jgi:hypothetical protein
LDAGGILSNSNVVTSTQSIPSLPNTCRSRVAEDLHSGLSTFADLRLPSFTELDETARYFDAWVDLNGDGNPEVVVFVSGRGWCGSGGCMGLILQSKGSTYEVITRTTITRPPIQVYLTRASNGWWSLSVWVQGGGIQPGYNAVLDFDGATYPTNPSTAPPGAPTDGGYTLVPADYVGKPVYDPK